MRKLPTLTLCALLIGTSSCAFKNIKIVYQPPKPVEAMKTFYPTKPITPRELGELVKRQSDVYRCELGEYQIDVVDFDGNKDRIVDARAILVEGTLQIIELNQNSKEYETYLKNLRGKISIVPPGEDIPYIHT